MAREPFLKTDNPVFSFMGKLGDVVVLNLAWLLCCVPVATIGGSPRTSSDPSGPTGSRPPGCG